MMFSCFGDLFVRERYKKMKFSFHNFKKIKKNGQITAIIVTHCERSFTYVWIKKMPQELIREFNYKYKTKKPINN
jgi:hypothetical protein